MVEEGGVGVETGHAARRADARAQQIGDAAGTATEIDTAPAGRDADAVEHDGRVGGKRVALALEALDLAGTPRDRIAPLRLRCGHYLRALVLRSGRAGAPAGSKPTYTM